MKVHLMERVPGTKGALTVLEIEFTSKARNVRVATSEGLEPLDLRGERTGGTYDAAPTLTRLHVPLRVTLDGNRTATVSVNVTDASGQVAAEAWEGTVRLESTRRKAPSAALLLGGFGAVALGIGAFVILPLLQPPSVPSLVGKPQGEAERALRSLGFAPVVEQVDSEGNDGRVIAQVPAAETQPPKNSPVLLRVGRRPASIEVPQLVGRLRPEAEASLAGTGVQVVVSIEDAPDTSDGRVLRQRPAAGNNVSPGATVELVVGRRPAAAQRDVPDVTGLAVADALAALERAGLAGKVEPALVEADSPKVGKIVEQSPSGGARLAEHGAVTVRVGEAAKPPAVAQIPYVVGEARAAAERAIVGAGFEVVVEEVESAAGPAGTVTSQDPAAGAARVGTRVTLRVTRAAGSPVAVAPPAMTDAPPAMTDAPPAMTDVPPAMGDPVVVAPPAMTDTPPAMTDVPPAMGDPVVVAPPAMTDTPPAMTDVPPAMGDPVVVAPPAMTDAPPAMTDLPPAMGDPVVVAPPAMTDAPPAMADTPAVEVPAGPTAPDLRRLTRAQAVLEARRAGVRVSFTEVDVSSDTPDGIVLRQFPAPGAPLSDGGVALVVARVVAAPPPAVPPTVPPTLPPTLPPTVAPAATAPTMPDLVGLSRAAAEDVLRTAKVPVRVTDEETAGDTPEGLVLHQKPSAGEPVGTDGAEIVVSRRAAPPAAVLVPDVVGRAADDAQRVIRDAGYVPRLLEEPTTPERAGLVLRQEPVSMRAAPAGSSVVLYVGKAAGATAPPTLPPPIVTPPTVTPPTVTPPTVTPPTTPEARPLPPPLPPAVPGSDLPPPRRLSRPGAPVPPPLPTTQPTPVTPTPSTAPVPPTRVVPMPPTAVPSVPGTTVVPGPSTGQPTNVLASGAGAETVAVPDFVGRDAAEAIEVAMRAGVLPVIVGDRDARAAAGRVRMQSAGAGSAVRTGSPVTIQVGAGASPSMVDVPNVAGLTVEAAVARLSSSGFSTSVVRVAARPGVFAGGVVVAQAPAGRFAADQARVVRLFTTER